MNIHNLKFQALLSFVNLALWVGVALLGVSLSACEVRGTIESKPAEATPTRFTIRDWTMFNQTQVYLVGDSKRPDQCLLVVSMVGRYVGSDQAVALTSQPWPCGR